VLADRAGVAVIARIGGRALTKPDA
jgi:hypothetical protein